MYPYLNNGLNLYHVQRYTNCVLFESYLLTITTTTAIIDIDVIKGIGIKYPYPTPLYFTLNLLTKRDLSIFGTKR